MEIKKELMRDGFLFSTDKTKLDRAYVHRFLSGKSYWAANIPMGVVEKSIENSLCTGIYKDARQIGFARIITDYATFGLLADVFVDEDYRGRGLSKYLMDFLLSIDFIGGLRRFLLGTQDAHGLYKQFGFQPLKHTERFMEVHKPDIYQERDHEHV